MVDNALQPCFILHRREYRNTSLLLELFTPEQGRLPAIARGARSGRSMLGAILQPFRPLLISLKGRGEVKTLSKSEPEGRALLLQGNHLYCGFYLNELLTRLLQREDPHPQLFLHYSNTLAALATAEPMEAVLRHFELELLDELGYGLLLDQEADNGDKIEAERLYEFHIEHGPVVFETGRTRSPMVVHGATMLGMHRRDFSEHRTIQEARGLMRRVLAFYLGNKPLKSRELFRSTP
ncbi:DNA recombination protein RecO [Candidatus Endoriftia persephone str. Guaymas]|nr:DNA recombination protein RecO [Candidatus Endoriftia persephone str. Guaymas]